MPKLPDLSGCALDDLDQLIASRSMQVLRGRRIKELQTELDRLEGGKGGARRSRTAQRSRQASSPRSGSKQQPAAGAAREVVAQFRGPNGEEYSGRGAIPRWARDLGVNDRAGLEKYRIS